MHSSRRPLRVRLWMVGLFWTAVTQMGLATGQTVLPLMTKTASKTTQECQNTTVEGAPAPLAHKGFEGQSKKLNLLLLDVCPV